MFKVNKRKFEYNSDFLSQNPALIKKGVVTAIYPDKATCDVRCVDLRGSFYSDIPYATGYLGPDGNGIDICPEVGSYCYFIAGDSGVMSDTDAIYTQATVFCFMSPSSGNSNIGNRVELTPGDVRMTSGSAEVLLRNTGDMYLFSGPTIGTAYLNTQQLMRCISPSYIHDTLGGSIKWTSNSSVLGGPVDFNVSIKKSADDPDGYVNIRAGNSNNDNFTFNVKDSDSTSSFTLDIPINGDRVDIVGVNGINILTGFEPLSLNDRVIITPTNVDINVGNSSILLENKESSKITITTDELVINTSKPLVINMDGEEILRIDKDALKKLVTDALIPWIKTHTHINGVGVPTQAPALDTLQNLTTISRIS